MKLPNQALWDSFKDGHRFLLSNGENIDMRISDAGSIVLPTGRIVASDPFLDPWNEPFGTRVIPGTYPIFVALAKNEVALVMVLFDEGPPQKWKAAKPKRFGVDSATGCLMDFKVNRFLRRKAEEEKYDHYSRRFRNALDGDDGKWSNVCISQHSEANVFLFPTWGGDGNFPSFFGYNADGDVICLVIDMFLEDVVEEGKSDTNLTNPS